MKARLNSFHSKNIIFTVLLLSITLLHSKISLEDIIHLLQMKSLFNFSLVKQISRKLKHPFYFKIMQIIMKYIQYVNINIY